MSETTKQESGSAAQPRGPHKDWELFWRIIAGLMLVVVVWVVWVVYQIMPRSVVTPLAYATPTRPITQSSAAGMQAPAAPAVEAPAAPQPAAVEVMAAPAAGETQAKTEGLRMATEIATLPPEKQGMSSVQEGKPAGVSAGAATSGNARP